VTASNDSANDPGEPGAKAASATAFADSETPLLDPSERMFRIGLITVVASLVSALITFLILTGLTPIVPRNEVVVIALFVNVLLIIAVIAIVTFQVDGLVRAWRKKIPGARLHIRIVALFSIIAALPAILLAIGATVSFARSLDNWFSGRVREIVENSVDVARTYVDEHGQVIRTDVVNMARDLDSAAQLISERPREFRQLVISQAGLRDLPAAYIIGRSGEPLIRAIEDKRLPFTRPTPEAIEEARTGQIPLSVSLSDYRISAIAKLESMADRFLYVSRPVSRSVLRHLQRTERNAAEYTALRRARGGLKWAHGLMYFTISMTALLAAVWTGMWFAGRFVAPIRRLIAAAQDVSRGNLNVELPEKRGEGDLRRLSNTFNTMTVELKSQRDALVSTNEQLTERRRFMEAVLSGVSAGVIGLDSAERITLVSRSATGLLGLHEHDLVGRPLGEAIPEFAAIHARAAEPNIKSRSQDEVTLPVDGVDRTFAVRVTLEKAVEGDVGSVVTFDDVTDLVSAQRTSAWADIARRIAHEIKNPLTPIQLSAERLRRKYGRVIEKDRETFDKLTETIERQAGHIKGMVDEFAAFARMPKPDISQHDLREAVQEPVVLFREAHTSVGFVLDLPDDPVTSSFDRRLITQAVTNLVKNATESVEAAAEKCEKPDGWQGRVITRLTCKANRVEIDVIDNGLGLPRQQRARLLEPYVTTKGHKGTGLGLAMVQKITEQHGGTLELADAPESDDPLKTGALIRITLPFTGKPAQTNSKPSGAASHTTNPGDGNQAASPTRTAAE